MMAADDSAASLQAQLDALRDQQNMGAVVQARVLDQQAALLERIERQQHITNSVVNTVVHEAVEEALYGKPPASPTNPLSSSPPPLPPPPHQHRRPPPPRSGGRTMHRQPRSAAPIATSPPSPSSPLTAGTVRILPTGTPTRIFDSYRLELHNKSFAKCERELERSERELERCRGQLRDSQQAAHKLKEAMRPLVLRVEELEDGVSESRAHNDWLIQRFRQQEAEHQQAMATLKADAEAEVRVMATKHDLEASSLRNASVQAAADHKEEIKRLRAEVEKLKASLRLSSAQRVQRVQRGSSARRGFNEQRAAVVRIQATCRGRQARQRLAALHKAARSVQGLLRQHTAKRRFIAAIKAAQAERVREVMEQIRVGGLMGWSG